MVNYVNLCMLNPFKHPIETIRYNRYNRYSRSFLFLSLSFKFAGGGVHSPFLDSSFHGAGEEGMFMPYFKFSFSRTHDPFPHKSFKV